jgi:hypothetical protein
MATFMRCHIRDVLGLVMPARGGMARATRGVLNGGCIDGRVMLFAGRRAGTAAAVCTTAADGLCC